MDQANCVEMIECIEDLSGNAYSLSEILDEEQDRAHEFVQSKWLSNQDHMRRVVALNTMYRQNFDVFAVHYLGLRLHPYESIILHEMGNATRITGVCARATAKSFIVGIYCVTRAILYPGSRIALFSDQRGQARKIITQKIAHELIPMSPMLRRSVLPVGASWIHNSNNDVRCTFRNGSEIELVTLSPGARGGRTTTNVAEEAREISKELYDEIAVPFTMARRIPFLTRNEYCARNKQFLETAPEIIITSSFPDSNWVCATAFKMAKEMTEGKPSIFFALDESVSIAHGIKTREQLISAKQLMDPITWKVEHENARLRENEKGYFAYGLLVKRQTLRHAFYPRRNGVPPIKIKKVPGEVRIVSCDIAAINKSKNDNSVFCCMRLLPEFAGKSQVFRAQVNYIEASRGYELSKQAIRIRQLFNDFEADYIVLDVANNGLAVYQNLARVLYDDERNIEYAPIRAMNNEGVAGTVPNIGCPEIVHCISASAKQNSEIATNAHYYFNEGIVELLVHRNAIADEINKTIAESDLLETTDERMFLEKPYLETMLLIAEMVNLTYERGQNTGIITLREIAGQTKDRYSAFSYGLLFAWLRANELCASSSGIAEERTPVLVSQTSFGRR
jgi:hypothetical protein